MRKWLPISFLFAMVATGLLVQFDDWGIVSGILIFGSLLGAAALGIYWKRSP